MVTSENMRGGLPEALDYANMPAATQVGLYHEKYGRVATALGRAKDPTYDPNIDLILVNAGKLFELGLAVHGKEQTDRYADALAELDKVDTVN